MVPEHGKAAYVDVTVIQTDADVKGLIFDVCTIPVVDEILKSVPIYDELSAEFWRLNVNIQFDGFEVDAYDYVTIYEINAIVKVYDAEIPVIVGVQKVPHTWFTTNIDE